MTFKEIEKFLASEENQKLFRPTNARPTPEQKTMVFKIADALDTKQTHRNSSCGRCYYNALRAIENNLNIF